MSADIETDHQAATPAAEHGHPLLHLHRPRIELDRFRSHRFLGLLLSLLLLLLAAPFVAIDEWLHRIGLGSLLVIVLFAAVRAANPRRHVRLIAAALGAACAMCLFVGITLDQRPIYLPGMALFILYAAYTIVVVLRRMVTSTHIDADILCGAAATYLLLGVAWAMSYWIIYDLDRDAFTASAALRLPPFTFRDFTYFSLSSLATLGMGDISPVNRFAQIWTTLEALTGNLYIAVLVSRLVSLYR